MSAVVSQEAREVQVTPVDQLPLAPAPSESAAILSVIERMATNPDIDPDRIERFIELKERMDRDAAAKAFNAAITAAKAEIKPIARTAKGHNGHYADLASIAEAIDPILSAHGLNYRHRTRQDGGQLSVTCILSHELGHAEETTLTAADDKSGNKNSIQAIGSTQTYLMRYTLVSALGLSTTKDDDGAAAVRGTTITEDQVADLQALIDDVGGTDAAKLKSELLAWAKLERLSDVPASKFNSVVQAINNRRGK